MVRAAPSFDRADSSFTPNINIGVGPTCMKHSLFQNNIFLSAIIMSMTMLRLMP